MLGKVLRSAALSAVLVSGLHAQFPVLTSFFEDTPGITNLGNGNPQGSTGHFGSALGNGSGLGTTPFSIWCADQRNGLAPEPTSWVSVFNGDLSHTRLGAAGASLYHRAGGLAATMTPGNAFTNQFAIWAVIHGKTGANICGQWNGGTAGGNADFYAAPTNQLNNCNAGLVSGAVTASLGINVQDNQWYVITDAGAAGKLQGGAQEYITHCLNCGFTPPGGGPAPEPATMSLVALGLAGMAGASLRRRRQQK